MYLIFLDSFQLYVLVYVCYMSLDVFPIYCIVYVRNIFWGDLPFFLSTSVSCHGMFSLCICIVYVHYVFMRVAGFFLTQTGFPMFMHCIRSLQFLKDVPDLFFF